MCDSFEDSMDMFDSDSDSLDSSNVKDATYQVKSIDEITHKMEQVIQSIVSSTEVIEFIFVFNDLIEFKEKMFQKQTLDRMRKDFFDLFNFLSIFFSIYSLRFLHHDFCINELQFLSIFFSINFVNESFWIYYFRCHHRWYVLLSASTIGIHLICLISFTTTKRNFLKKSTFWIHSKKWPPPQQWLLPQMECGNVWHVMKSFHQV